MSSSPNPNPSITITSEESELASEQLKELMKVTEPKVGNPKHRFTPDQRLVLLNAFSENQNPNTPEIAKLAAQTNLKLSQVKVCTSSVAPQPSEK